MENVQTPENPGTAADEAAADEKRIYTLYFDRQGMGPTAIELKLQIMHDPVLAEMRADRVAKLVAKGFPRPEPEHTPIGMRFLMGGGFNLNNAPAGGGFFFSDRRSIEELHRQLGALLEETKTPT